MPIDTFIAYVGVYGSAEDAEADYQAVKELHTELGLIDAYDAAVIVHEGGHKVKITKKHETPTASAGCSAPASGWRRVSSIALFPFAAVGAGRGRGTRGRRRARRARRARGRRAEPPRPQGVRRDPRRR